MHNLLARFREQRSGPRKLRALMILQNHKRQIKNGEVLKTNVTKLQGSQQQFELTMSSMFTFQEAEKAIVQIKTVPRIHESTAVKSSLLVKRSSVQRESPGIKALKSNSRGRSCIEKGHWCGDTEECRQRMMRKCKKTMGQISYKRYPKKAVNNREEQSSDMSDELEVLEGFY